jgi:hypothetical protein
MAPLLEASRTREVSDHVRGVGMAPNKLGLLRFASAIAGLSEPYPSPTPSFDQGVPPTLTD